MMIPRDRRKWVVAPLSLALVAVLLSTPAHARSGGHFEEINPLVRRSIIDDPDPTGSVRRIGSVPRANSVTIPYRDPSVDGSPAIFFHPATHEALVTWSRWTESGFDVVLTRLVDGRWDEPILVAGTADDELDPQLTVDPGDGSIHLVYWVRGITGVGATVVHRRADANLAGWDPPRDVSSPGEVAVRPSATFHEGRLRVVYESHGHELGSTPRLIVMASEDPDGFGSEVVGVSRYAGPSRPFLDSDPTGLRIEWMDEDGLFGLRRSGALRRTRHDLIGVDGR